MSAGAFTPLLPEVARVHGLADWQLGVVAGSFGFARMVAAMPAGTLASRRLGSTLTLALPCLLLGMGLLAGAGSFAMLVLGRFCMGVAHTLGMVGGLTAVL